MEKLSKGSKKMSFKCFVRNKVNTNKKSYQMIKQGYMLKDHLNYLLSIAKIFRMMTVQLITYQRTKRKIFLKKKN